MRLLQADQDFKPKYLMLASPVVRELVYEKAYRHNLTDMQLLVVGGTGKQGVAGFAGYMFEQYGHCVLPEGDMHLHMRKLLPRSHHNQPEVGSKRAWGAEGDSAQGASQQEDDSPEDEEVSHHVLSYQEAEPPSAAGPTSAVATQLQGMDLQDARMVHLPRVQRVWDAPGKVPSPLQRQVYLQPPTSNNPSWDAYYAHDDQRYVLQYTVSNQHGVKQAPIKKLLARLSLKEDDAKLVFVVPEQVYDTFTWQPWQGSRGKPLIPSSFLRMEQWVMKLPMTREPGKSRSPSSGGSAGVPP